MGTRVLVVQHGEKVRAPGDPGLTVVGRRQAKQTASWIARSFDVTAVWSSPLRRARETAEPLAAVVGLEVQLDARFRERMNWDGERHQTVEAFVIEWERATIDRSFVPRGGDSSDQAASRFLDGIADIADGLPPTATVAVVAHGGVTVDTLRTVAGDPYIRDHRPRLLADGVPCGAVTILEGHDGDWTLAQLPFTDHLEGAVDHRRT